MTPSPTTASATAHGARLTAGSSMTIGRLPIITICMPLLILSINVPWISDGAPDIVPPRAMELPKPTCVDSSGDVMHARAAAGNTAHTPTSNTA
jgi:hypothetical protein